MARMDKRSMESWVRLARRADYNAHNMSRRLGISARQLRRYTQSFFRRSPQDWLDEQRLRLAANLLKQGQPVKKVAYRLGFKQVSHFSRKFKGFQGVSPKAFLADGRAAPALQPARNNGNVRITFRAAARGRNVRQR